MSKVRINPVFAPLFSDEIDDKRYFQVYGGRGSGKSFGATMAMVQKVRSEKYRHKIIVLRQVMTTIEDSSWSDILLAIAILDIEHEFKKKTGLITHIKTGNTISFKGISTTSSNTAKLKSLSGVTTLLIEEAEEVESFEEFSKIDESIRVIGIPLKIIMVYNPGNATRSWIHKQWFKRGLPSDLRQHDTEFMHSTYLDNIKNLHPSVVRRYEDLKDTDPIYYKNTILAEWTLSDSLAVYGGWRLMKRGEFVPDGDVWYGLDFGYGGKDSTALIKITYFKRKYYIEEMFCENNYSISDTWAKMKEIGIPSNAKIFADSAVPTLIEEVRRNGFKSIRKAKKGKIDGGIKSVQDKEIIMVSKGSQLNYSYLTFSYEKKGVLPHEPDTLAATRYGITSRRPIENKRKRTRTARRGNGGYV